MPVVGAQPGSPEAKGFGYMPPELHLQILEALPNIPSLNNAVAASGQLRRCFSTYSTSISTRVVKNEVPRHSWTHAVVANKLLSGDIDLPDLDSTDIDGFNSTIDKIRHLRDTAPKARVTFKDALAISGLHKKITELRDFFVTDCANAKQQQLHPLFDSIRYHAPLQSELIRVEQAIYLFQILACFCRNITFSKLGDMEYTNQSREKVSSLQKCIVERLVSPWEMYQVIGIQAWFRRAIHGFGEFFMCRSE